MKKFIIIAGVLVSLLAAGLLFLKISFTPSSAARKSWRDRALTEITARVSDPVWITNEIATVSKLAAGANPSYSEDWFSKNLILMTNGDWLVYASICQKENRRIEDLFLARGSDGQWYYSTYHFCIGMIVLTMDEQAPNLPSFVKKYSLKPFDGKSDECLKKTWPVRQAEK